MASVLEQLRPAQPGGRRRLHFDNGRWEDYHSIFVEHPSGRWDRILVARDDGEVASAIARAINGSDRAGLEQAAQIAELHAERLKHTSHHDGLGMGWRAGEELCLELARRIRAAVAPSELGGTE